MNRYIDKLEQLKSLPPIISVCGDDCAVCPRYLAKTEEELHETAIFWHKVGWRDSVVSNEEIKCTGCGSRPTCSFDLLPCTKEHGVNKCRECGQFQCERVKACIEGSKEKMQQCRQAPRRRNFKCLSEPFTKRKRT